MIINNIKDVNAANEIIIKPLLSNSNLILPFDQFTHAAIVNDRIDFLRTTTEHQKTYDEYVADYIELHGILDNDYSNWGITLFPDTAQRVYPFSKTHLFKTLYSNVLPSVINLYFNYMKSTQRIIQLGSGVGKCLLIKPVLFTEEDFTTISSMDVPYSSMTQLLIQATDHLAKQEVDIKFLLEKLDSSTDFINFLSNKISVLESQIINTTTHTWR